MGRWNHVVDLSTVAWFCIFVVGFMAFDADLVGLEPLIEIPESYQTAWNVVNWSIWGVFAVDVWFKYRRIRSPREFVRRHWFDLLLLIPFFRVLAILRVEAAAHAEACKGGPRRVPGVQKGEKIPGV